MPKSSPAAEPAGTALAPIAPAQTSDYTALAFTTAEIFSSAGSGASMGTDENQAAGDGEEIANDEAGSRENPAKSTTDSNATPAAAIQNISLAAVAAEEASTVEQVSGWDGSEGDSSSDGENNAVSPNSKLAPADKPAISAPPAGDDPSAAASSKVAEQCAGRNAATQSASAALNPTPPLNAASAQALACGLAQPGNQDKTARPIAAQSQPLPNGLQNSFASGAAAPCVAGDAGGDKSNGRHSNGTAGNPAQQGGNDAPASSAAHASGPSESIQKDINAALLAATNGPAAAMAAGVGTPMHGHAATPSASGQPASSAGTAANQSSGAGLPGKTQPLPLPEPLPANDVVQASRLYQRAGGAEMHISMDTDLFGSIDVRAVVHQSTLTATIGVQRSDVQALLTSDLPVLQHSLLRQSLHVAQISILGSAVGSGTDQGGSHRQQQSPFAPSAPFVAPGPLRDASTREDSQPATSETPAGWGAVLSVRV